jgi:hypothetical protein
MSLLSDYIGTITEGWYRTASSAAAVTSNTTGVCVQGMDSILFLCEVLVAPTTDGPVSDGSIALQIQYASNTTSAGGSDAASSAAGWTCTDAVYVFSSAIAAKAIITIEVDCSAKGFDSPTGYLFPALNGDSVSIMHVCAIPVPGNNRVPIAQTIATVVADD